MAEESIFKEEQEIESHKLLYKYQYAFLHMQKSFTSPFKSVKAFEERAQLKYLQLWKMKMQKSSHLRVQVLLMKSTLKTLEFTLKQRLKLMLLTYFLQITKTSALSKFSEKIKKNYEDIKENNVQELEIMEKEVKNLKKSLSELEMITKSYSKREIGLRNKLENLKGRGSCEKMKLENKGLRLHLEEMDKKMIFAFKELNLLLETLEEIKKKKLKKLKKKSKVCIKNKHAGIGLVL